MSKHVSGDRPGDIEVADIPCACATVRRAARAVTQLYDSWLRSAGIEGPQFALLSMLERLDGCTQSAMGQRFDLDKTTLSRNLKLLKRNGWIAIAAGEDARERRVILTPEGRRRLAAAKPAWKKAQEQLRGSMSRGEWNRVGQLLNALTRAAQVAPRGNLPKVKART
jgi:DNA-binding MarR family transcriptional regulator